MNLRRLLATRPVITVLAWAINDHYADEAHAQWLHQHTQQHDKDAHMRNPFRRPTAEAVAEAAHLNAVTGSYGYSAEGNRVVGRLSIAQARHIADLIVAGNPKRGEWQT